MTIKSQNKQSCIVTDSDSRLAAASNLRKATDVSTKVNGFVGAVYHFTIILTQKKPVLLFRLCSVVKYSGQPFNSFCKMNIITQRTFEKKNL